MTAPHSISATFDYRVQVKLDCTQNSDLNYTSGWTPAYAAIQADSMVSVTNIGGLGYGFTCDHVAVWNTGNALQPLTRAGFYNFHNTPPLYTPSARPFALTGLLPGQSVALYACSAWDGPGAGAFIVYGDSGEAGKQARTIGNPGTMPTLANFTEIGTAIADGSGTVTGTLHGSGGVDTGSEGQVGGFIFAIDPAAPPSPDADGDGMDDAWETLHFGDTSQTATGDFDHDGTDNLTEYRLGLTPESGTSRFEATAGTPGTIQWPSALGLTFTIERSTSLEPNEWSVLEAAFPGTAGTATYTDPSPPSGHAFYRIGLNP